MNPITPMGGVPRPIRRICHLKQLKEHFIISARAKKAHNQNGIVFQFFDGHIDYLTYSYIAPKYQNIEYKYLFIINPNTLLEISFPIDELLKMC